MLDEKSRRTLDQLRKGFWKNGVFISVSETVRRASREGKCGIFSLIEPKETKKNKEKK